MEKMLALQKERQYVRAENVDEEIDQWVYVLYGLMPDEIAIL